METGLASVSVRKPSDLCAFVIAGFHIRLAISLQLLVISEMTPGEDVLQKSSGELISNLASLLAQMVVMDHLSESAPSLSKAA